MEPITLVFLVLGYVISRSILRPLLSRALAVDAPKPPKAILEPAKSTEAYDCEVYSERLLDEKMVAANLMTLSDMAVCENLECPNCLPSRPRTKMFYALEHKEIKAKTDEILRKNAAQKKRLLDEAKSHIKNRGVDAFSRPPEVPSYAHCHKYYNPQYLRDEITWEWMDSENGRVNRRRQIVAPEFEVEIYSDQQEKPVHTFTAGRIDTERIWK